MSSKRRHSSTTDGENDDASWLAMGVSSAVSYWSHTRDLRNLHDKNKNLRRVYKESGMHYGAEDVTCEEELAKRKSVAVKLRQDQVKNVLKHMRASQNLELCFLVDATDSMGPHIVGVKDSIRRIVGTLTRSEAAPAKRARLMRPIAKNIRLAFVGYRDIEDVRPFEVLDFTDSVDTFHAFCASVVADGGADDAEDVFGGLEKVNELEWTTDGSTRVLFHIADAPCHGKEFHNFTRSRSRDSFPDGDPKGRLLGTLLGQLSDKNINYFFGKIDESTDKMLDKFSAIYEGGISQFDVKDLNQIYSSVVELSSMAVTGVASSVRCNPYKGPFATKVPKWGPLPVTNGVLFSYKMPNSIEDICIGIPMDPKKPNKAKLKMAKLPFGCGSERVAYYGRVLTDPANPQDIVMKKNASSE